MSFLGLRKAQKPLHEADTNNLAIQITPSLDSPRPSLKSKSANWRPVSSSDRLDPDKSNLRRRLSSLASLTRRPKTAHGGESFERQRGIGFTPSPGFYSRSQSRSPSPSLSLTIRRPSGLGRRESVDIAEEQSSQKFPRARTSLSVEGDRRASLSAPNLTIIPPPEIELSRWEVLSQSDAESDIEPPPPRHFDFAHIPADLLQVVFSYASAQDLISLARVSHLFLQPARNVLYSNVDLRSVKDSLRVERCLSLLASNREVAALVRAFHCSVFPSSINEGGGISSFMMVTMAIALTNMHQLQALTLPHFVAHLLHHTTFLLKTLTLLSEALAEEESSQLTSWLATQPTLISLSLPNLTSHVQPQQCHVRDSSIPSSNSDDTTATRLHNVLPNLSYLHAPTSLVSLLVPDRPVETLFLTIHATLYEGLKPSAVMQSLAKSSRPIKGLTIGTNTENKIDARTFERVLMSAGAELGSRLERLDIEWVLEDEVLYKLVLAVLPRFKVLHTLRLFRRSTPSPPPPRSLSLPLPSIMTSSASPPPSPSSLFLSNKVYAHSTTSSPPASPMSTRSRFSSASGRASSDIPLSRAHERTHLAAWNKHCASLTTVVFLSGAKWKIGPGIGEAIGVPLFTHVGTAKV